MRRVNPHVFSDAFRNTSRPYQSQSQRVQRVMDTITTNYPRMSARRQMDVERKVVDEFKRRAGNRVRWPF